MCFHFDKMLNAETFTYKSAFLHQSTEVKYLRTSSNIA